MFSIKKAIVSSPIFFSMLASSAHAVCTWTGSVNNLWSNSGNWTACPGSIPGNAESVIFPAGTNNQANIDDIGAILKLSTVSFTGGNYTITSVLGPEVATYSLVGTAIASVDFDMALTANCTASTSTNTQLTLTGNIKNAFAIIKTGGGFLRLTGNNSYSGGTEIRAGTVAIGAANNIGAGPATIDFTSGLGTLEFLNSFTLARSFTIATGITGTLLVDPTRTATVTGTITGLGALEKSGTGTLILTGANTYSGGTTITAGILQGNTTSLQGNITNNAAIVFDQAAGATYAGVISGSGTFTKQNAGVLTLGAANTYSGATLVSAGTLQAGIVGAFAPTSDYTVSSTLDLNNLSQTIGSLAGSGTVTLGSGNLQVGNANSTTFSGSITGTGSVTKVGSSVLTLTGTSSYSGATNLNAGTLVVNGSISSATTLSVAAGALLKGTGLVTGVGTINGTIQPGNSIGTLTLAGNQTFNAGSTLDIEVTPSASSLLIINPGSLTIQPGSTLHLTVNSGFYAPGTIFPVIQTPAGTVTGVFSSVTSSMPLIQFTAQYLANEVDIVLLVVPFSSVITSGNAAKVAACLDQIRSSATGDLANVIGILTGAPTTADLEDALNRMTPAVYTDLALAQQNNTFRMRSSISTRLEQVYQKACTLQNKPSHIWVDGYGDWVDEDGSKNKIGYQASTGGVLLGYDYTIGNHFVIGAGAAYSYSDLDFNRSRGNGHIQSYYGTLYAGFFQKYFFLNAMVTGAYNDYEAHRKIEFLTIKRTAKSHPQGSEVAGHLDVGLLYQKNHFLVSPFAMVDYVHLHQDSFKERGADSLDLKVRDKSANMLRAEAGLQGSYCIARERYKMRPYAKLSWVGEYRYAGKHEKASLAGTDCTFNTTGLYPNRNIIAPGVGLTTYLGQDRYYISLNYEGEFAHNYSDNKANVQVAFSF